ncbi:MAG TPA: RyR domain-containing protein, partial [Steroidobacteraceae bacterium]|nr:RyR domain-containing protein [Steroidobacteraceae bacterium]
DTGFELICRLLVQAQCPGLDPLVVVLVDASAVTVARSLHALSPAIEQIVSFVPLALESRLPESTPHLLSVLASRALLPTCIYLACDEFALVEGWHRELELAYRTLAVGCPLILRVRHPDVTASEQSLLAEEEALDVAPRMIHDAYLERWRLSGQAGGATTVDWESLAYEYQEDNRAAADHYWVKARELGFLIGQGHAAAEAVLPSVPLEPSAPLEPLARAEHRRWVASRALAGWHFGARRDDMAKIHPDLQPWAALNEAEREKDRDIVRSTASVLQAAGYRPRPIYRFSWPHRSGTALRREVRTELAAAAVSQASAHAPAAVANVTVRVEDAITYECAQALGEHPGLTVSLVVSRSLAGLAVAAGSSTLAANRLAERAWELWDVPEDQVEQVMGRWPTLRLT